MTRLCVLIIAAMLAFSHPGKAHGLDEYVQATRLDFGRDRVGVELDLTPGVAVAAEVFALIDRDHDMRITPHEIADYAQRVLRDLSLRLDDHEQPLTLLRAESPSWEQIHSGEGTIRIRAFAGVKLTNGTHRIRYENMHQRQGRGAFLVNALVPSMRDIEIRHQHRDVLQHAIEVDFNVWPRFAASWWLLPGAGLTALLVRRRRGRTRCHSGCTVPSLLVGPRGSV